jgi:hypothetical protein
LTFGCTHPSVIALTHATASTALAAPSKCPIIPFVELILNLRG